RVAHRERPVIRLLVPGPHLAPDVLALRVEVAGQLQRGEAGGGQRAAPLDRGLDVVLEDRGRVPEAMVPDPRVRGVTLVALRGDARAGESLVDRDAFREVERPLVHVVGLPEKPVAAGPTIVLGRRPHVAVLELDAEEAVLVARHEPRVERRRWD